MTRPVKNHTAPTQVLLDVLIYAILDLNEKDQKFVSYVWVDMLWFDEFISWYPPDFCDIDKIIIPSKQLWIPDLTIEEMTEKDKTSASPHVIVLSSGRISLRNDMMVISTCKMNVYKFPFDNQSCNLTFKSAIYSNEEIHFSQIGNSSRSTNWTLSMIRSQSEWLLINMDFTNKTVDNFGINQSMLVYTIHMKRRSVLYVVNFMLPILFFLGLDLASFLISDSSGEKLGFKVTVLLAVTVMQLILNEILPNSSDRIPLIATYIVGIFGLMMLSLTETIVVMYLLEKDSKENEPNADQNLSEDCGDKRGKISLDDCFRGINTWIHSACVCDVSAGKTPPEVLPLPQEGSSSQLMEESNDSKLGELVKPPFLLLSSKKEEAKPAGYWKRHQQQYPTFIPNFYPRMVIPFMTQPLPDVEYRSTTQPLNIISQISIKRRAGLYIINFMLPILFFVGLDLASFMISDSSGEKLSFKVTVLLAVTVMQLILNDILPSSSNRIPLIASYCIGIFGMMMLSLLETVLVMFLLHKDTKEVAEKEQSMIEDCEYKEGNVSIKKYYTGEIPKLIIVFTVPLCDVSPGQTPSEVLLVVKEVRESSSQLMEESCDFEKLSYELRELVKMLLNSRTEEARPSGYWKEVCKKLNKEFFIFYIIALALFLVYMFYRWSAE
ncbi:uncharacterized protein LOC119010229 [Acanthopagrus latus]|uniref:uncharacterized protein LOC119010229 n=1 Tax=Acanthopagrus latus TaxID=8177 RepID=UPI00187C6F40|nr:uncharacterized protein LOC119010229 [Acanthopagrus latus]